MKDIDMLNSFCSVNDGRIKSPFNIGDYTYATNSFIIIRIPRKSEFKEKDTKFISLLSWDHDKLTDWYPIPVYNLKNAKLCLNCNGTGKQKTCQECKGFGSVTTNTGYNEYANICMTCDGEGIIEGEIGDDLCSKCGGTGKNLDTSVIFGNRHISMKILEMVKSLPSLRLSMFGDSISEVRFVFDGGVGLLMPMNV